jgi:hypothetical protein
MDLSIPWGALAPRSRRDQSFLDLLSKIYFQGSTINLDMPAFGTEEFKATLMRLWPHAIRGLPALAQRWRSKRQTFMQNESLSAASEYLPTRSII